MSRFPHLCGFGLSNVLPFVVCVQYLPRKDEQVELNSSTDPSLSTIVTLNNMTIK